MLTLRKQKILCLLVARYIERAEPVSSADLKADYGEEISSATIRAELAALEKEGYLVQPHVSAGRIPTAKAYKVFVEAIPTDGALMPLNDMHSYLDRKMDEVSEVIRSTARILSDTTNYTSVIVVKNIGGVMVRNIKLVDIGGDKALVIIITDSGVLKDCIIDLPPEMGETYLHTASDMLNRIFAMHTVEEISELVTEVDEEIREFRSILDQIIHSLENYKSDGSSQVFIEGTSRLLDVPEYQEQSDKMRGVLSVLDNREMLTDMVSDGDIELSIRIGKDDGIENGSLVTATYRINDNQEVHAGVIGPERMDYRKVISVLRTLEQTIKNVLDDKED